MQSADASKKIELGGAPLVFIETRGDSSFDVCNAVDEEPVGN
jgi:hypothetical protein